MIHKWRHFKIQREERLHSQCKVIDDEKHFMLHCEINSNLRENFIIEYAIENPDLNNILDYDKISILLYCKSPNTEIGRKKKTVVRTEGLHITR